MALTRITKGVIKPNENYDTHDINSTGIITATGANITGNMTVGGVLTYEDVSSIDAIGIITANQGIHVGSGISAVGIITALSFVGDGSGLTGVASTDNIITGTAATFNTYPVDINAGMTVAGVSTFTGVVNATLFTPAQPNITSLGTLSSLTVSGNIDANGNLDLPDNTSGNASIRLGNSQDFFMNHNGTHSYIINNTGNLYIRDLNGDVHIQGKDNEESIIAKADGAVELYYNNVKRLETSSVGVSIPQDLDVDGHTNLDNVSVAGVATVTGSNINIEGGSASLSQLKINSTGRYRGIQLDENGTRKAHFQHDATSNNLVVGTAEGTMQFNSGDTPRVILNSSGHWVPYVDSTYDLGLTGTRWRNLYADTLYGDGSNLTGISGVTINNNADNRIITGSGTAATLNGESNLTFDGTNLLLNGKILKFDNVSSTPSASGNVHIYAHDTKLKMCGGSGIQFEEGGFTRWHITSLSLIHI